MNENEKNHRLLWNELARTGGDDKEVAFRKLGLEIVDGHCFACKNASSCEFCPINWSNDYTTCFCEHCVSNELSPFAWWDIEENKETRKLYAHHIANMEWKEGGWNV